MKLQAQTTYKYFYDSEQQGNDVTIERVAGDTAYATSGSVGGFGPFAMLFDVNTGKGKGDYIGTHLEEYAEGEVKVDL